MINTLLGIKEGQSQKWTQSGRRLPVTYVRMDPCVVVFKKTTEKDGYCALQLGIGERKKAQKSIQGHIKKANLEKAPYFLAEVPFEDQNQGVKQGDKIRVENVFTPGDLVAVIGTSKGKGFAGVVKRWHFAGGPKTHGQSDRQRAPGSIGSTTTPGRVLRGKKMAGRMGGDKVTVKNLKVVEVLPERNLLVVSGLVPGARGKLLVIKKLGQAKKFEPLFEEKEVEKENKNA